MTFDALYPGQAFTTPSLHGTWAKVGLRHAREVVDGAEYGGVYVIPDAHLLDVRPLEAKT